MKTNINLVTGLTLLAWMSSCSNILNVEPTSVITVESFWKTSDDARGALVGMYVDLRTVATNDLYVLGEARSDVITLGTVGEGGYAKYYFNNLIPSDAGPTWRNFYSIINSANLILRYVPGIDFTSENEKKSILAQAYTMRAYVYYVMTRTWGALPLRTEPVEESSPESVQVERSSESEVFQLIKADIEAALELYPSGDYGINRSFWCKPATEALKADVYLWTGKRLNGGAADFQVALESLNKIEGSKIELLKNYADIFDYQKKGNNEVLMAVRFEQLAGSQNYFVNMYIHKASIPGDISNEAREIIGSAGSGNNIMAPTNYTKSLFSGEDQRKSASFYEVFRTKDGEKGEYIATIITKGSGTVIGGERLFLDDIILYRYADVLLMKAEVKNALGIDPSDEINKVRERAYGDNFDDFLFVAGSQEYNDDEILKERLRELAFEGKRWWDLLRFGKAIEMLPSLREKENPQNLLLWPISNSVLSLENKVKQNPGY